MYNTINRNHDIQCCHIELTNLPHVIMGNDRLTSINNTTQMDLQGQAASESDGYRHISGSGGQAEFVRAAYASKGGKSFVCMSSARNAQEPHVLSLTSGNAVTSSRSDMKAAISTTSRKLPRNYLPTLYVTKPMDFMIRDEP